MLPEAELKSLVTKWMQDLIARKADDADTRWLIASLLGTAFMNWGWSSEHRNAWMAELTKDIRAAMQAPTDAYITEKGAYNAVKGTDTKQ